MTAAQRIENQITRQLLRRRQPGAVNLRTTPVDIHPWTDRLIAILAVTAGLVIVGSYLEELLWAVVAATTVFTLR
jgi:hypothetical protein